MKQILMATLILLLISLPVHAGSDYDYFSRILQLESRWARLSEKAIQNYQLYLEKKGLYKNLTAEANRGLRDEIDMLLKSRLTWDKVGERVIATVLSACSDETLREFAKAYRNSGTETTHSAASKYLDCATKGVSRSMPIFQMEFKNAAPALSRIAKKYRNK
ncbi:MAG: hypothetical protein JAZ05_02200 [Candidatus Thiodiazotropha taylori]|nr:hypothetical protein [Candidatus Thiodiazotropha taylori]MCW4290818.1 hypothetical protein [Candidatus Thiodiazotropha taylori]